MRSKASSDAAVVVEWGGERSTVEDDKIKQVVQGWNQADNELKQCENAKERVRYQLYSFKEFRWLSMKSNLWILVMQLTRLMNLSVEKLHLIRMLL